MINLKISRANKAHHLLEERISELFLSKKVVDQDIETPVLQHGKHRYEGIKEINGYIDELEKELTKSHQCKCEHS